MSERCRGWAAKPSTVLQSTCFTGSETASRYAYLMGLWQHRTTFIMSWPDKAPDSKMNFTST